MSTLLFRFLFTRLKFMLLIISETSSTSKVFPLVFFFRSFSHLKFFTKIGSHHAHSQTCTAITFILASVRSAFLKFDFDSLHGNPMKNIYFMHDDKRCDVSIFCTSCHNVEVDWVTVHFVFGLLVGNRFDCSKRIQRQRKSDKITRKCKQVNRISKQAKNRRKKMEFLIDIQITN